MAKRSAAMQSRRVFNMPAPRLRRGLGMPPVARPNVAPPLVGGAMRLGGMAKRSAAM